MHQHGLPGRARSRVLAFALSSLLLSACSDTDQPATAQTAQQPESAAATAPRAVAAQDIAQVNACSLLDKAEVEAATGRTVLAPREERLAEMSVCTYGDAEAPAPGGNPLSRIAQFSVFTGGSAYYAGPQAQARDVYAMIEKNAGEVERIAGLGDKAHWTGSTLRAVQGPHMIEVEVDTGKDARPLSEQLARMMLERLPAQRQ